MDRASGPAIPRMFGSLTAWEIAGYAVLTAFTGLLSLVALVTLVVGAGYFLTSLVDRPVHAFHEVYRPGGLVGLMLGLLGTALMVVMLLYSVRKWVPFVGFMGSPQWWMRFHMVCGVFGPVFILLHEGFKWPSGIVGIGFWAMVIVGFSGFFGRYLFGYFPATAAGRRMDLQHMRQHLTQLRARLVTETQHSSSAEVAEAVRLARELEFDPRSLAELIILDLEMRRRVDHVRILLHQADLDAKVKQRASRTLVAQLRLKRSLAGWDLARRYFRYWSLFHQPLAIAMYGIIVIHIVQAILFGGVLTTLFGYGT